MGKYGFMENNSNLKDEIELLSDDIDNLDTSISNLKVKINSTSKNVTLVKRKIASVDAGLAQQKDKNDKLEQQSDNVFSILGGIPWFLIGLWASIAVFLIWKRD